MIMHKCMGCGKEYTSDELGKLRACPNCNGTTFMFKASGIRRVVKNTDTSIESDIKVLNNGIFEINVGSMAQHEPVIIEGEEGVFFIKFPKKIQK
ncbi:MAG: hypothetical protein ACPL0A_01870 [Candidatus Micrarchaeia archaeon]